MDFGDVITWHTVPANSWAGIGGDTSVVWHANPQNDVIYELSTSDLSVVRSNSSPSDCIGGIGGNGSKIWACERNEGWDVYELSITDFSSVRSALGPGTVPYGIGGDSSKIWHCDYVTDLFYELSTSDFSSVRSGNLPGVDGTGAGGDASTIWHCDSGTDRVYELSLTDFSVVRYAGSPSTIANGIGGTTNVMWHCDSNTDYAYELFTGFSVSYYFNSRSTANWSDPANMVDGILTNYASTDSTGTEETLDGNTCPGTNLGTIQKVELRAYAHGDGGDRTDLTPVFSGGDGDTHQTTPGTGAGWNPYQDITNDTNHPTPWTWADVVALDCKVKYTKDGKANLMYVSKVEIRVNAAFPPGHPTMKRWQGIPGMKYLSSRKGAGW